MGNLPAVIIITQVNMSPKAWGKTHNSCKTCRLPCKPLPWTQELEESASGQQTHRCFVWYLWTRGTFLNDFLSPRESDTFYEKFNGQIKDYWIPNGKDSQFGCFPSTTQKFSSRTHRCSHFHQDSQLSISLRTAQLQQHSAETKDKAYWASWQSRTYGHEF